MLIHANDGRASRTFTHMLYNEHTHTQIKTDSNKHMNLIITCTLIKSPHSMHSEQGG